MMLCSVLIASRRRFDKLLRCIESVYEHSFIVPEFEVIVRFHKTDLEARDRCVELDRFENVSAIWGEDLAGYESLGYFYNELIEQAQGKWCWHLNDDMVVITTTEGKTWNTELDGVIGNYLLVQPELHQLNNSVYVFDKRGPAPIHPRKCLGKLLLRAATGAAVDSAIYEELVEKRKWQVVFLEGIGVHHQWGGVASHVA
jgi:hypothetical protein